MNWQPKHPALQTLVRAFVQEAAPLYVVGGVVRDALLQRVDHYDLDLVVEQGALSVARRVADRLGWSFYPLDADRDVARLVFNPNSDRALVCDVAAIRGGSLAADLRLRDFTVNALAFVLEGGDRVRLIDVCGGVADLEERRLRRVTATSLADDPVRLLRAIRFVHQLSFSLEDETGIQIKRMGATVKLTSPERIRDELWKLLATPDPAAALHDLKSLGLLTYVLPEVGLLAGVEQSPPHDADVFEHTIRVVAVAAQMRDWLADPPNPNQAGQPTTRAWERVLSPWRARLRQHFAQPLALERLRREWLVWCALLHDVGKPAARSVELDAFGVRHLRFLQHERIGAESTVQRLEHLRFSRHEIALAQAVVANHMRPHLLDEAFAGQPISRRACFRFFRDVGSRQHSQLVGIDTLLVGIADLAGTTATLPSNWDDHLAHASQLLTFAFAGDGLQVTHQPILDGHTLMQRLRLDAGRQVGEILEHVLEAQAAGEVHTLDDALALAHRWLDNQSN